MRCCGWRAGLPTSSSHGCRRRSRRRWQQTNTSAAYGRPASMPVATSRARVPMPRSLASLPGCCCPGRVRSGAGGVRARPAAPTAGPAGQPAMAAVERDRRRRRRLGGTDETTLDGGGCTRGQGFGVVWENRLLASRVNLIAGMGSAGKDVLCCDIVACVSTGRNWPDGAPCAPGLVGYVSPRMASATR